MPRLPRLSLPGMPQHVIQRGNNRQACFYSDEDNHFYLTCLREACEKYQVSVHAYVLMTNHAHLLMTPAETGGVSYVLQTLGRRYVRYINHLYRRSGTLWEGRYHSSLIESERYLLTCYRYIELNPVRAGMTDNPEHYPWSSYHHNALGKLDKVIEEHSEYIRLGSTSEERRHVYKGLFRTHINSDVIDTITTSTCENRVLGSEQFKDEIEVALSVKIRKKKAGRPKKNL